MFRSRLMYGTYSSKLRAICWNFWWKKNLNEKNCAETIMQFLRTIIETSWKSVAFPLSSFFISVSFSTAVHSCKHIDRSLFGTVAANVPGDKKLTENCSSSPMEENSLLKVSTQTFPYLSGTQKLFFKFVLAAYGSRPLSFDNWLKNKRLFFTEMEFSPENCSNFLVRLVDKTLLINFF